MKVIDMGGAVLFGACLQIGAKGVIILQNRLPSRLLLQLYLSYHLILRFLCFQILGKCFNSIVFASGYFILVVVGAYIDLTVLFSSDYAVHEEFILENK